jgi:predicted DNA-binding transcriptional regulator AlpA
MDGSVQPRTLVDKEVAKEYNGNCSDVTLWRHCRKGIFPSPVMIGDRRHWYLDELIEWRENLPRKYPTK